MVAHDGGETYKFEKALEFVPRHLRSQKPLSNHFHSVALFDPGRFLQYANSLNDPSSRQSEVNHFYVGGRNELNEPVGLEPIAENISMNSFPICSASEK